MSLGTVMPSPYQTLLDANGNPVVGGLVYTYVAGTVSTPIATYTSVDLGTPNANPIVTDSAGRFVAFLSPGMSYKFVYTTSAGVTAAPPCDNITTVPSGSSSNVGLMNTDFTTTSATYVDVTSATVTLTTSGRNVFILYTGPVIVNGGIASFTFAVDGVDSGTVFGVHSLVTYITMLSVSTLLIPSAGAHTFKLRAKITGANTLTMSGASQATGSLSVSEARA